MSDAEGGAALVAARRRLGIGDVLRTAILALWIGRLPILLCLSVWIAAETALSAAMSDRGLSGVIVFLLNAWGLIDLEQASSPSFQLLMRELDGLPNLALRAVLMTAMLRIVLCGPQSLPEMGFARASLILFAVNLIWALIFLVSNSLANRTFMPVNASGQDDLVFPVVAWTFAIVWTWLLARFSMIYPLCAIEMGIRPVAAWRLARGHVLRMTALLILLVLPYLLARWIANALLFDWYSLAQFGQEPIVGKALSDAVFMAVGLTILMVVFAVAYTRLAGFPAAGIPGSGRTPQQLADTFD